jgi:hypothetical protein
MLVFEDNKSALKQITQLIEYDDRQVPAAPCVRRKQ